MRRGLMSWSPEEMPAAQLDARVRQVQALMNEHGWAATLIYTSIACPGAVHWLTHFTPYWSEAMLVVLPTGAPVMLASLSKRVHPWMREVAHLGELIATPRLGEGTARLLTERTPAQSCIAVLDFDALPFSVAAPLTRGYAANRWANASMPFQRLRTGTDAHELALIERADAIARSALQNVPSHAATAAELGGAIEAHARLAGAEDLIQRIAPDLSHPGSLQRIDGPQALGTCYAVEVSLAYKGAWVRRVRNVTRLSTPQSLEVDKQWARADAWWAQSIASLGADAAAHARSDPPGMLQRWTLEGPGNALPLQSVDSAPQPPAASASRAPWAVLSAHLRLDGIDWFGAAPIRWHEYRYSPFGNASSLPA